MPAVRAIEALHSIGPTGQIGEVITSLLMQADKHRLRAIVGGAPAWVSEEILSVGPRIGDDGAVVKLGKK